MEEKQGIKISLSTLFLILAIIAIIVMALFIYKINKDKIIEIEKSIELQSQVNNLQEKIDSISKTINSDNFLVNENTSNTNDNTVNNKEQNINLNIGTFSVKNITEDELNDDVLGWINILENNKFEIPRTCWYV